MGSCVGQAGCTQQGTTTVHSGNDTLLICTDLMIKIIHAVDGLGIVKKPFNLKAKYNKM